MILEKACAKVNLLLDVVRKRQDGYHDLRMIMQSVSLYDEVHVRHIPSGIRLVTEMAEVARQEENIAWKAAGIFLKTQGISTGAEILLKKNIPVAAGMAGGSADAAAVLRGLNRLFGTGLTCEEMIPMAVRLGADVPFCLFGGTMRAEGIGDKLSPVPSLDGTPVVIVNPGFPVATPWVFRQLNAGVLKQRHDPDKMAEALKSGDIQKISGVMGNTLEAVTLPEYPVLSSYKEELMRHGASGALMSGSGPTVFALFSDGEMAASAAAKMKEKYQSAKVYLAWTEAGGNYGFKDYQSEL